MVLLVAAGFIHAAEVSCRSAGNSVSVGILVLHLFDLGLFMWWWRDDWMVQYPGLVTMGNCNYTGLKGREIELSERFASTASL